MIEDWSKGMEQILLALNEVTSPHLANFSLPCGMNSSIGISATMLAKLPELELHRSTWETPVKMCNDFPNLSK